MANKEKKYIIARGGVFSQHLLEILKKLKKYIREKKVCKG